MFVDDVYIHVKAGDGGNGFVHFFRNRNTPKGGPDGGDGGKGGDIYVQAESSISLLRQFRFEKKYYAENGGVGAKKNQHGKNGDDLVLKIPVGTEVLYDNGTGFELTFLGEKKLLCKGGQGGFGNAHFKSSRNTTPENFTPGIKTKVKLIHLKLKLIADIGLVGLPNAGKSSLLNEITNAQAKVANYPFTTLEPNLGVTPSSRIIADIPGLISGASLGKGLGYKFLKHIEKTGLILHCISLENEDLNHAYQTVRQELTNYSATLASKKEIIVLTKSDLFTPSEISQKIKSLTHDIIISIHDLDSLKTLLALLEKKLQRS